jgi:hypothetical protein
MAARLRELSQPGSEEPTSAPKKDDEPRPRAS